MACGGHHTAAVGDHLQVMTWGGGHPGKNGLRKDVEGR